jgi:hypothetical protein
MAIMQLQGLIRLGVLGDINFSEEEMNGTMSVIHWVDEGIDNTIIHQPITIKTYIPHNENIDSNGCSTTTS